MYIYLRLLNQFTKYLRSLPATHTLVSFNRTIFHCPRGWNTGSLAGIRLSVSSCLDWLCGTYLSWGLPRSLRDSRTLLIQSLLVSSQTCTGIAHLPSRGSCLLCPSVSWRQQSQISHWQFWYRPWRGQLLTQWTKRGFRICVRGLWRSLITWISHSQNQESVVNALTTRQPSLRTRWDSLQCHRKAGHL